MFRFSTQYQNSSSKLSSEEGRADGILRIKRESEKQPTRQEFLSLFCSDSLTSETSLQMHGSKFSSKSQSLKHIGADSGNRMFTTLL